MKNMMTVAFLSMAWIALVVRAAVPVPARPLQEFGQFSVANPNVRAEIRLATGATLEGFGDLWPEVTGLGVREEVRFRDKAALARIVESLHTSSKGQPWDGQTGDTETEIRVYFENNKKFGNDLVWYFYRNHRAYCVPELYHWSAKRYKPSKMFLVSPSSSRHFEELVGPISRRARRPGSGFSFVDLGGD